MAAVSRGVNAEIHPHAHEGTWKHILQATALGQNPPPTTVKVEQVALLWVPQAPLNPGGSRETGLDDVLQMCHCHQWSHVLIYR